MLKNTYFEEHLDIQFFDLKVSRFFWCTLTELPFANIIITLQILYHVNFHALIEKSFSGFYLTVFHIFAVEHPI